VIVMPPTVTDAGTPRERRKMYVRCPSGHLVEIKGYARGRDEKTVAEHRRLWRYRVAAGQRDAFVFHYGSDGTWVQLFYAAAGYLGTQLWADATDTGVFYTQDCWRSETDFRHFMEVHRDAYERLDAQLEHLTLEETFLGAMNSVG